MLDIADIDIDPADVFSVPPASSTAAFRFSQTWRVWASTSPMPAIYRRPRAIMPEMNTSLPRASTMVACENCPFGWPAAGK